jgi:hypothetical protein
MHTATEINTGMFSVERQGSPIEPGALLGVEALDRFGIVVDAPFGALGAGLLLSLAITSYFDVPGKQRRSSNVYPEIYLFHRGGPWGCHSSFDFWPEGKEVFVEDDPVALLRAINHYGITHLAVPERTPGEVAHRYREPEIAADRLKQCFAYAPAGQAMDADIHIRTHAPQVIWNFDGTLRPEIYIDDMERAVASDAQYRSETPMARDFRRVISYLRERWHEVARDSDAYRQHLNRAEQAKAAQFMHQSVRQLDVASAIAMLA